MEGTSRKVYTQEYFDNKTQQARIKSAILAALPDDGTIYYCNLIVALAELLADFSRQQFKSEVYGEAESGITYTQKSGPEWVTPERGES